jgi:hypothetical protein
VTLSVKDKMVLGSIKGFAASFTTIGCICLTGFVSVVFELCSVRAEAKRMDRGFCRRCQPHSSFIASGTLTLFALCERESPSFSFSSAFARRSLFSLSFSFASTVRVFFAVPSRGVFDGVLRRLTSVDLHDTQTLLVRHSFSRLSRQPPSHPAYSHPAIHIPSS